MQFVLTYDGRLKSNGKAKDKHEIRLYFQPQLRELCKHPPFSNLTDINKDPTYPPEYCQPHKYKTVGEIGYDALFRKECYVLCELDVLMLRYSEPGSIVHSGDIDNQLKTLFDSLQIPDSPEGIPEYPADTELLCLLEDDAQISRVSVATERLLEPRANEDAANVQTNRIDTRWVHLILTVRTRLSEQVIKNVVYL
jgi:hypothetical protein